MSSYSYLSAIGFHTLKGTKEWNRLITQVVEYPTEKYIAQQDGKTIAMEYYRAYGEGFGLLVRGILDEKEQILVKTFDPIVEAKYITDVVEVEVLEQEEDIYHAFCEEEQTGTEIIFHLQNVIDYWDVEEMDQVTIEGVKIVGLGIEGKVILPVEKSEVEKMIDAEEEEWYQELIKRAREGDEEAQELIDIEEEETAEIIAERLQYEDFLTIVEGYFIPFEDIDTTYSVLGVIQEVGEMKNKETGEKLFWLYINCMGMHFEICINEKDLTGIPLVGMRFMGICWVQGQIVFS
ncbi:MAG: DUF3881 family protein [Epulopiscium sp.]|nr:DUF3881 family protein [Candidatus Epulonipiscium sp.]